MPARRSQVPRFVILVWCLVVAGTQAARAQALCPEEFFQAFNLGFLRAPSTITVEAELRAFGDTLPGGTLRMPVSGGIASDGLALEGVSLTPTTAQGFGSTTHAFDVVVDLRASDNLVADLELVIVDGERTLRLGAFTEIKIHCEAKSVSGTFSISDHDFASFFAGGRSPTLRVKRTTVVGGC